MNKERPFENRELKEPVQVSPLEITVKDHGRLRNAYCSKCRDEFPNCYKPELLEVIDPVQGVVQRLYHPDCAREYRNELRKKAQTPEKLEAKLAEVSELIKETEPKKKVSLSGLKSLLFYTSIPVWPNSLILYKTLCELDKAREYADAMLDSDRRAGLSTLFSGAPDAFAIMGAFVTYVDPQAGIPIVGMAWALKAAMLYIGDASKRQALKEYHEELRKRVDENRPSHSPTPDKTETREPER